MGVFASVVLLIALLIGSVVYDVSELDRVIVMILALLGFSWIWGRTSLNGIAMQRVVLSDRMHVGEIIREEMTFETRSRIPKLWVEVQDTPIWSGTTPAWFLAWEGGAVGHGSPRRSQFAGDGFGLVR